MRSILLLLVILSGTLSGQIAHDVEVFSEDGENFTLYLNGRQINEEPSANVRIKNIEQDQVSSLIVFEDTSIPDIKTKYFQIGEPGTETSAPQTTVYRIVITKKKGYKLRLNSMDSKKIQEDKIIIINN